ncbi:MAG: hypothetical protein K9J27_02795, partial [Bacteroidales bacterium]|nr:hypothetical protein [Bacteroidales bacterium]
TYLRHDVINKCIWRSMFILSSPCLLLSYNNNKKTGSFIVGCKHTRRIGTRKKGRKKKTET